MAHLKHGSLGKQFNSTIKQEPAYILEKNILFIWIGSKIPQKYITNVQSYVNNNPSYAIYLFTDANNRSLCVPGVNVMFVDDMQLVNRDIFDIEQNYGAKADILRYELVHNYGGIYCDIDSVSVKAFDHGFERAFVTYTLAPYYNIQNACFGFPKGSMFLQYVIGALKENYHSETSVVKKTGPTFFTTCFVNYNDDNIALIDQKYLIFKTPESYTYHTMDHNWK